MEVSRPTKRCMPKPCPVGLSIHDVKRDEGCKQEFPCVNTYLGRVTRKKKNSSSVNNANPHCSWLGHIPSSAIQLWCAALGPEGHSHKILDSTGCSLATSFTWYLQKLLLSQLKDEWWCDSALPQWKLKISVCIYCSGYRSAAKSLKETVPVSGAVSIVSVHSGTVSTKSPQNTSALGQWSRALNVERFSRWLLWDKATLNQCCNTGCFTNDCWGLEVV